MGGAFSRSASEYKVVIEEGGVDHGHGQLSMEDKVMVLTQGEKVLRFPLNAVRRYGYDKGMFSFQAGSDSDAPGNYILYTKKARQVFRAVDAAVGDRRKTAKTRTSRSRSNSESKSMSSVVAKAGYDKLEDAREPVTEPYAKLDLAAPATSKPPKPAEAPTKYAEIDFEATASSATTEQKAGGKVQVAEL